MHSYVATYWIVLLGGPIFLAILARYTGLRPPLLTETLLCLSSLPQPEYTGQLNDVILYAYIMLSTFRPQ